MFKSVSQRTVMVQICSDVQCSGVARPDAPWFLDVDGWIFPAVPSCMILRVFLNSRMTRYKSKGIWGVGSPTRWSPSDLTGDAIANCNLAQKCATPQHLSVFRYFYWRFPRCIYFLLLVQRRERSNPQLLTIIPETPIPYVKRTSKSWSWLFFGRRCFCWFLES